MSIYSASQGHTNNSSKSFSKSSQLKFSYTLYLSHLLKFRLDIDMVEEAFGREEIWGDQIADIIDIFIRTQNTIKTIPNLLSLKNQQKVPNPDYRYKIIVGSQYLNCQIDEAIDLIGRLELSNRSSKRVVQRDIRHLFLQLKSSLDNLLESLESAQLAGMKN